jgi:hypothetical protein
VKLPTDYCSKKGFTKSRKFHQGSLKATQGGEAERKARKIGAFVLMSAIAFLGYFFILKVK